MSGYDVGDPWAQYIYVRDINGTLANATAVAVTLTFPDGTTAAATVGAPSPTGTYLATYPALTQPGLHKWDARATGTNACADNDTFIVRGISCSILSLADAKATLGIPSSDLSQDEKVRDYNDASTAAIEKRIGPVTTKTYIETVKSGDTLVLGKVPVVSITTITSPYTNGVAVLAADVWVDANAGTVRRVNRACFFDDQYTVTYVAGRGTAVDQSIIEAARVTLQHFWDTQRSEGIPGQSSEGLEYSRGILANKSLPPRANELLEPFEKASGIG